MTTMRKAIALLGGVVLAAVLAGCQRPVPAPTIAATPGLNPSMAAPQVTVTVTVETSPTPTAAATATAASAAPDAGAFEALKALLPSKVDYQWHYEGTAEYAHTMKLDSANIGKDQATYQISGEVADMSGGESGRDHAFTITYTISDGVLRQHSTGDLLLDSPIPDLELLRAPLQTGATWQQTVQTGGQAVTLKCTIVSAGPVNGHDEVTVEYTTADGSVYQKRTFAQGQGVTLFERNLSESGENNIIGYHLRTEK